ncbi:hypothetical protein IKF63_01615 [Candidatus Saccharibacteria bacterium]|nr:hypothetical protein [Candidatus Saccharibacteria bacterium]
MKNSAAHGLPNNARSASLNKKELSDNALSFAKLLYDLWRESRKNEIIEADKTIYDNEESVNNN